jgi:hypothetical protein
MHRCGRDVEVAVGADAVDLAVTARRNGDVDDGLLRHRATPQGRRSVMADHGGRRSNAKRRLRAYRKRAGRRPADVDAPEHSDDRVRAQVIVGQTRRQRVCSSEGSRGVGADGRWHQCCHADSVAGQTAGQRRYPQQDTSVAPPPWALILRT